MSIETIFVCTQLSWPHELIGILVSSHQRKKIVVRATPASAQARLHVKCALCLRTLHVFGSAPGALCPDTCALIVFPYP